jgi:hypothetical protein
VHLAAATPSCCVGITEYVGRKNIGDVCDCIAMKNTADITAVDAHVFDFKKIFRFISLSKLFYRLELNLTIKYYTIKEKEPSIKKAIEIFLVFDI